MNGGQRKRRWVATRLWLANYLCRNEKTIYPSIYPSIRLEVSVIICEKSVSDVKILLELQRMGVQSPIA